MNGAIEMLRAVEVVLANREKDHPSMQDTLLAKVRQFLDAESNDTTPRTDAQCMKAWREDGIQILEYVVPAPFACNLERELFKAQERAEKSEAAWPKNEDGSPRTTCLRCGADWNSGQTTVAVPYPERVGADVSLDVDKRFEEIRQSYRGLGEGAWDAARWYAQALANEVAKASPQ